MLRVLTFFMLISACVLAPAWAAGWGSHEAEAAPGTLDLLPWDNWVVEIGPAGNSYPGGSNDASNLFGTYEGCEDDYDYYLDVWDVLWPIEHWVALRFTGDEWGDNPTYPDNPEGWIHGLSWDIREPYGYMQRCKIWKAEAVTDDPGYTYDLLWNLDPFPGFGLQLPPWFGFRLDMDGSFADEPPGDDPRWFDFDNYEIDLRPGNGGPEYTIEGLPQTGEIQVWYIIAGYQTQPIGVPEPAGAAPIALVLAAATAARRRLLRR